VSVRRQSERKRVYNQLVVDCLDLAKKAQQQEIDLEDKEELELGESSE
jgi:hypothetical protein